MPGMSGSGISTNDPTIVSAFHNALMHQWLIVLLVLVVLAVGWNVLRLPGLRAGGGDGAGRAAESLLPEPDARRFLRIGFGLLWVLDGILQAQAAMPLGMVPQVIQPAASSSPSWVQHLVNSMATTWTYHPIAASTAAVWIQVGIGVWLLVAPRGIASRLAGIATVGWGLLVWVFGEAFGGIFAPGLTWMFGAPGAVLFYCLAGLLIALPERKWQSPRLGRGILGLMGLFFLGMALLQAWPGRGFWQGRIGHGAGVGSLASIVQAMSQTNQPHLLSSWVTGFGNFDVAHGWAVNLFVVIALALIGFAFLVAPPRVLRVAVVAGALLCLADWILVEDLGFLGGVGTDPNSMIPMALLFIGGYLAITRVPAPVEARSEVPAVTGAGWMVPVTLSGADLGAGGGAAEPQPWRGAGAPAAGVVASARMALRRWQGRLVADSTYAARSFAALGAVAITLIGVGPMAAATTKPNAATILARAAYGAPEATNTPSPAFRLMDQNWQKVTLNGLHGKTVALIFLNPECSKEMAGSCAPVQELRLATQILGTKANGVELVAIDTNPLELSPGYLERFDRQNGLGNTPNWLYLTGRRSALTNVLSNFGAHMSAAANTPIMYGKDSMGLPHGDGQSAYVIDGSGRIREVVSTGIRGEASTKAVESSVAVSLANAIERVAGSEPPAGQ